MLFFNIKTGADYFRKKVMKQRSELIRSHHTLYAFLGGVGVVMFWHGIWEGLNQIYASTTPISWIGHPAVSMTIGIVLLTLTGLFVFELVGREALAIEEKIQDVKEDVAEIKEDVALDVQTIAENVQNVEANLEDISKDVQTLAEEVSDDAEKI